MKVLVTGSAGFVGRHFVRRLFDDGNQLLTFDIEEASGDCREFFRHDRSSSFDLVVHCAAVVGGRTMIDGEPLRLACEDLSIDAELFRWALRARPKRIVYFSSAAAYAIHFQARAHQPVRLAEGEHMSGTPDQSYGTVKRVGEYLARMAQDVGIRTHVFRPFSGYGSDQSFDYPFPSIVRRVVNQEDPLTVWSDAVRDFVHIDDVVGCVLEAIRADRTGPVNICTGRATSFVDLAQMIAAQAGYSPAIEVAEGKPTGVHRRVGNPARMNEFYTPRVPLEAGIRRALNDAERLVRP